MVNEDKLLIVLIIFTKLTTRGTAEAQSLGVAAYVLSKFIPFCDTYINYQAKTQP